MYRFVHSMHRFVHEKYKYSRVVYAFVMSERSPHPEVAKYLNSLEGIKSKAGTTDVESRINARKTDAHRQATESLSDMRPVSNDVRRCLNERCANPWCATPSQGVSVEILSSGDMIPVCKRHADLSNERINKEDI